MELPYKNLVRCGLFFCKVTLDKMWPLLYLLLMIETINKLEFDGSKLKEARKDRTMSDIAKAVGISRQSLMQIEQGITKPSADTLVKLCAALNLSISDLTKNF